MPSMRSPKMLARLKLARNSVGLMRLAEDMVKYGLGRGAEGAKVRYINRFT